MAGKAQRCGLLLVVSSPSGAGKTTLSRRLLREHPDLRFSVSYTTRPIRPGERDGVDYHFVSDERFDRMIAESAFVEYAVVHGRRYGTAVHAVRAALDLGQQVLLDVDYQGATRLAEQFECEARLVFILPPSLVTLEQRLRARNTDSNAVIEQRLLKAREELRHYRKYHYLVVNSDVDKAYGELDAIYCYERAQHEGAAASPQSADAAELARSCRLQHRAHLVEELLRSAAVDEPFLSSHPASPASPHR